MKNIFTVTILSLLLTQLAFPQSNPNMAIELVRNSFSAGDYFSPGDVLNMGTQNFTIEVKISVKSFPLKIDDGAKIINKGLSISGTPRNAGYGLRVWNDNGLNKLIFMVNVDSVFCNIETSGLETGTCYHVGAVRENETMRLYLDGNLVADSVTQSISNVDTDLFFTIGALGRQPVGSTTEFFDGQIDEVRIWNVVRSENQIRAFMNDTLSAAYYNSLDSGLVAYYRCDELEDLGVGGDGSDDVRDFSANGFNADSYGDPVITATCSVVGVNQETNLIPNNFELDQNYPNPFNPSTKISWQAPVGGWQTLKVYDLLGREVAIIVDEYRPAGTYEVEFNTQSGSSLRLVRNLTSGVYFYQLKAGDYIKTKKMVLIK